MNSTDQSHYVISKLIRIEAQMKSVGLAVELLNHLQARRGLGRKGKKARCRTKRPTPKASAEMTDLLQRVFGTAAVEAYVETEMAHFADMFPDDAVFVREHLELSAAANANVLGSLILKAVEQQHAGSASGQA